MNPNPKDKNGNHCAPGRVNNCISEDKAKQHEREVRSNRARKNIEQRDAEALRKQKAEKAATKPVPISNYCTNVILKSPLLRDEESLNLLAIGAFSPLKIDINNFEVLKVQEALQAVNVLKGKADGIFGSETEQAVKTFQNSYTPTHTTHTVYKLNNIDGVVGKNTVLALDEAVIEEWIVENNNEEMFWALSWLEQNSNHLVIPGSIAMGASEYLLSGGNIGLITDVSDHYADYKSGRITKGQYDYRRKISLEKLKQNIGPFEKWLFGNKTTNETIRIARSGGLPETANITANANKLKSLATVGKVGGIVLAGVGITASCMQIADANSSQEKNEIFVETLFSTTAGAGAGYFVGVFLISNPVAWGTAIVLATGTAAFSYATGKLFRYSYDTMGLKIDFVSGLGIDGVCK